MIARKLPTVLAALFILLNFQRVNHLVSGPLKTGWLGLIFAAALTAGVFVAAYWTRVSALNSRGEEDYRSRNTRHAAWVILIALVLADGFFNLVEVLRVLDSGDPLIFTAAVIYGVFPTISAAAFGALQGFIDRLPMVHRSKGKRSVVETARMTIIRVLDNAGPASLAEGDRARLPGYAGYNLAEELELLRESQHNANLEREKLYECKFGCGFASKSQAGANAHVRFCEKNPINRKESSQIEEIIDA